MGELIQMLPSRVVTLADGETIHNAFFDRNFSEDAR